MIRWILAEKLGTLPFEELSAYEGAYKLLDVRDLVDKSGNMPAFLQEKIDQAVSWLREEYVVLVCCDHGISRSNAVAAGVLSVYQQMDIDQAIEVVVNETGEKSIKLEVLNSVRLALNLNSVQMSSDQTKAGVVITGASGFIGTALLKSMQADAGTLAPSRAEINLLSDVIALDGLIKKNHVRALVHLAAPRVINTNQSLSDTLLMLKNTLDVCRENRLKFIFLSSWEVFSGCQNDISQTAETNAPCASTIFGMTKLLAEQLIFQYGLLFGLEYTILRPSVVYGAGSVRPRFLHHFSQKAKTNEVIITHEYTNGLPLMDMLHVDDLIRAIKKSIGLTGREVFNIASGESVSTKTLAEFVVNFHHSASVVKQAQIGEVASRINLDIRHAQKELEWQPLISWMDGIKSLLKEMEPI
jgi:UDP-glucuronate decarboxylase